MNVRAIAAVGAAGLLLSAWGSYRVVLNRKAATELAGKRQRPPAAVRTATAGPAEFSGDLTSVATLSSPYQTLLSPPTAGRIIRLDVREGDAVRKGQILVEIDPAEAQSTVATAEAAVAQARSRLAEARLGAESAEVGATSAVATSRAGLGSARADVAGVQGTSEARVAAARATVADTDARVAAARSAVKDAAAVIRREQATLAAAQVRFERLDRLATAGALARQLADDAAAARAVAREALAVARAQEDGAKRAVTSAQAVATAARRNVQVAERQARFDLAAARARLVGAQSALDVARAGSAGGRAYAENLAALGAAIRAAEAGLEGARVRLAQTRIAAPIDGVVTARTGDPGALASPGTPVLTLQTIDALIARAAIPVESAAGVTAGIAAEFRPEGGKPVAGTVARVNPAADATSRQFDVQVELPNPQGTLRPGGFGSLILKLPGRQAPVAVPREAVSRTGDGATVSVVLDGGKIERRPVETGRQDDTNIEITDGLRAGEQVVVLAYGKLRDGATVRDGTNRPREGARPEGRGQQTP